MVGYFTAVGLQSLVCLGDSIAPAMSQDIYHLFCYLFVLFPFYFGGFWSRLIFINYIYEAIQLRSAETNSEGWVWLLQTILPSHSEHYSTVYFGRGKKQTVSDPISKDFISNCSHSFNYSCRQGLKATGSPGSWSLLRMIWHEFEILSS